MGVSWLRLPSVGAERLPLRRVLSRFEKALDLTLVRAPHFEKVKKGESSSSGPSRRMTACGGGLVGGSVAA